MDRSTNWTHVALTDIFHESNFSHSAPERLFVTAPTWSAASQDLKWVFMAHSYGFACLFGLLSFYTFFSFLNLRSLISSRPFMSTINIFLCLLGLSRSSCLFIDPYNLELIFPKLIGSIIWDLGFPFLTSAFCLIQLAFLQLTQLKFGPEKFQKESCLSLVIITHFSLIIVSDIAIAFHIHYTAKYVVQTIFLVWSILLYVSFLYAGYKIMELLRSMPNSMLTHDSSIAHQKGIMQLAMLAPYNNLATSVATALMPTLLGSTLTKSFMSEAKKDKEIDKDSEPKEIIKVPEEKPRRVSNVVVIKPELTLKTSQTSSTVPEVYVRPPTPTPSLAMLPTITVSSPSRRSSMASRRDSDVSRNSSRRSSECSMRYNNEETNQQDNGTPKRNADIARVQRDVAHLPRRHSENVTPSGSIKDMRRISDFTHEKSRGSQFNIKLRRNSDYVMPKKQSEEIARLASVIDNSPQGSRRNSDTSGLTPAKMESRRNSDVPQRRSSQSPCKPLIINRRISDVDIQQLDKSPTQQCATVFIEKEIPERSESDSDHPDYSEKASLMTDKSCAKNDDPKGRKKSLTWKNDKIKDDDITTETSLLTDMTSVNNPVTHSDCILLNSVLNHIAYVNRAKTDTPLHISEANTAAARKSQIRRVLNVTYTTAILGIILCLADLFRLFGPYGLLIEAARHSSESPASQLPKSWVWLVYQTLCRGLEFAMSCAMANITKQPSASPRHQYLHNYHNYSMRGKQRNNLYI